MKSSKLRDSPDFVSQALPTRFHFVRFSGWPVTFDSYSFATRISKYCFSIIIPFIKNLVAAVLNVLGVLIFLWTISKIGNSPKS